MYVCPIYLLKKNWLYLTEDGLTSAINFIGGTVQGVPESCFLFLVAVKIIKSTDLESVNVSKSMGGRCTSVILFE